MKQHSEVAWGIASKFSRVLASETRDLAALIDEAISAERERCAGIAESFGVTRKDWGTPKTIAAAIRADQQSTGDAT